MKKNTDTLKIPMTKNQFMLKKRKNVVFGVVLTITILLIYVVTYEFPPLFGLSIDGTRI